MSNKSTPYHRSQRGSALFSGMASLFSALPLSLFPPRKSAWEQSGDDIRAAWQDVGDGLRWAMDEYDREHGLGREHKLERERQRELQLQQLQQQQLDLLRRLEKELMADIERTKARKEFKRRASLRKKEDRACA